MTHCDRYPHYCNCPKEMGAQCHLPHDKYTRKNPEPVIKELVLNNKVYAKYILEKDHIFIKILIYILTKDCDHTKSEDYLIELIGYLEGVTITKAYYLNI